MLQYYTFSAKNAIVTTMNETVSIIALKPHGNVISELRHIQNSLIEIQPTLYPFYPLFLPLDAVLTIPEKKNERHIFLSNFKEKLLDQNIEIRIEKPIVSGRWIYCPVSLPTSFSSYKILNLSRIPPFQYGKGIPLCFFKDETAIPKTIEIPEFTKKLRVCSLTMLRFLCTTIPYGFSWEEFENIWIKKTS